MKPTCQEGVAVFWLNTQEGTVTSAEGAFTLDRVSAQTNSFSSTSVLLPIPLPSNPTKKSFTL